MTAADCHALFRYWRSTVMGSLTANRRLPNSVGGYFFQRSSDFSLAPSALPLGEVRRTLLALLDRTELSDEERSVVELYYGLHGLPLPFASRLAPDLAAGRDESVPRSMCRAATAKIAAQALTRDVGDTPLRAPVSPILEPWFRAGVVGRNDKMAVIGRAYARALAGCDGPHAGPTVTALHKWYADCGYGRSDLRQARPAAPRPNRNALNRAAALMELALYEEVVGATPRAYRRALPIPTSSTLEVARKPELVTHPDLVRLIDAEVSPEALLRAAEALREKALDGVDVDGLLALFLRTARPRLLELSTQQLERVAVAVSYVATSQPNPFLALEWLGHFLDRCGVTDRTFTVLVNTSEAASAASYHRLATGTDRLFRRLQRTWEIPAGQIPRVEHAEAEQQRLIASSFRLEQIGADHLAVGDTTAGIDFLEQSIAEAIASTRLADRILNDHGAFPERHLANKAGRHGGDLTWPWYLGALLRTVEPLAKLHEELLSRNLHSPDLRHRIESVARSTAAGLADYGEPITSARFDRWWRQVSTESARLGAA